ncbi:sensor histidine kinase [Sphingomonas koreensis]|nr:sensor histidine kinase [Sphingomonas koreensis]
MHPAVPCPATPHQAEPLLLVEEISHRVINEYTQAIAGLRLAARGVANGEAQTVLTQAAARLLTFADAHRALQAPIADGTVDLADALARLCATMSVARLQERGIKLTLSAASLPLAAGRCWRVALIISELITNSMRHGLAGRPGSIRVELDVGDPETRCRVVDDGCSKQPIKPGRGFGVVTGLASEIGGAVGWCFGPSGTTVELSFPNTAAEQVK